MEASVNTMRSGDFWGGLAAMLVALPSAIAFGVTIYSPLGGSYAAHGALAGILGATALGLVAPALGGTNRLITAPCAPAAAVLSAFILEYLGAGNPLEAALILLTVLGLAAGLLQVAYGAVGLGRLIKYMPYPVVSGYLSGVGLYIIASQVPKFVGAPKGSHFWHSLAEPAGWQWEGIVVGAATMAVMVAAPRFTRLVPAAILALLAGMLTYFGLAFFDPALLTLTDNRLIVGPLGGAGAGFIDAMVGRWRAAGELDTGILVQVLVPALTLSVLLSIDTLKTCVVLDAMTRSRHDSNRELIGQGMGNVASAVIGGIPGAGTMGATLVNISSGATSRFSGLIEGVLALVAFLVLGSLIAWVPVAALAGILIVIGVRMIDLHSLGYLRSRSTVLDFVVIASVVATALTVSLIAASGVGIVLAVLLFVREEIGGKVVRRKRYGNESFSRQIRLHDEMEILLERGHAAVIFELQGSLFFGTADQIYTALEKDLARCRYVTLDLRRVQAMDITAAHVLNQLKDILGEHGGQLLLSQIPKKLPNGKDVRRYLDEVGLLGPESPVRVFGELDEAVEWVEDRILEQVAVERREEQTMALHEFEVFRGRKEATLAALEARMEKRVVPAGQKIFSRGDAGDELLLIRRGAVRIMLPLGDGLVRHVSTFGRGSFFGEMAFLDGEPRSADAVAYTETELFLLSRKTFDTFAEEHKKVAMSLLAGLASVLAGRLRYANAEMQALES